MKPLFTVTEMGDILAGAHANSDEKALLYRQIRNFQKKGFLKSAGVRDDRGTLEFDPETFYRVRILSALVAIGFDADSEIFRHSVAAMEARPRGLLTAPSQQRDGLTLSLGGLRDAIRGVQAGELWQLSFWHQVPHLHGFRRYVAAFHYEADAPVPVVELGPVIFTGTINLNAVFAGLPRVETPHA